MSNQDEVKKIAYGLYEESGRIEGRDLENWIEAERIVAGKYEQQAENKPGKRSAAPADKRAFSLRSKKAPVRSAGA